MHEGHKETTTAVLLQIFARFLRTEAGASKSVVHAETLLLCGMQTDAEKRQRAAALARMRVLSDGAEPVSVAPLPEGACHVCGEDEEADNDRLLHCDACRVHVHQACYGVADAPDGRTWLCDVCRAGACARELVCSGWHGLQVINQLAKVLLEM